MAVTEQLNIRLQAGEKEALSAAARQRNVNVSEYVRGRLFGSPLSKADQLLLDGLAELGPKLHASLERVNVNMREIAQLRKSGQASDAQHHQLPENLDPADLASIGEHLGFAAAPAKRRA